ncbi:MAG TPA: urease accessory protein UreD [Drouetiella sp.]
MPNVGIARLSVEHRANRSVVVSQYSQAPLQLHTPLYLDGASHPTMFLRSPSAGFLDGDEHRLHVEILDGAALELRTQAAALIYPGHSEQHIAVNIACGGKLLFHPHPLILTNDADFVQRIRINLQGDAQLNFCDSWSCGRVAMDERWRFKRFDNQVEIYRDEKILYRERAVIEPAVQNTQSIVLCDRHNFFSTRFLIGAAKSDCDSSRAQFEGKEIDDSGSIQNQELLSPDNSTSHLWRSRRGDAIVERYAGIRLRENL